MVTTTVHKSVELQMKSAIPGGGVFILRMSGNVGEGTVYVEAAPNGVWSLSEVIGYRDALTEMIEALKEPHGTR